MKKAYLFIFCLLVFFTACEQSPIFYDISQEIKLENQSIKGTVYSMRKIDSTLYAANGMLNQKSMEANKWSKISVPDNEIVTVAYGKNENKKYLYILGNPQDKEVTKDEKTEMITVFTVYSHLLNENGSLDSSDWKTVTDEVSFLFDNQAENSNAYITKNGEVYMLNGDTVSETATTTNVEGEVKAAININGADSFSSTVVFATNGTIAFLAEDKKVNDKETSSKITSLFVFEDKLYAGTLTGVQVAQILENGSISDFVKLGNNAESAFGTREVVGVWKFDNNDNFFVSVTSKQSSTYDALWGFDASINKWNLE